MEQKKKEPNLAAGPFSSQHHLYSGNVYNFQKVLKTAVSAYGIPSKSYVDNGCGCANEQLSLICGSIGTVLLHTKIRDGAGKGKVERHFRTLKERRLYTPDIESIHSLAQFNSLPADYIRGYNTTPALTASLLNVTAAHAAVCVCQSPGNGWMNASLTVSGAG